MREYDTADQGEEGGFKIMRMIMMVMMDSG